MDNRMTLYHHIVLSGGSTMYPGMPSRMERDIKALYLDQVLKVEHACQCCHFPYAVMCVRHLSTMPALVKGISLVLQGNREGLRKLKLKIEDPPRRKHTGDRSTTYAHESRLLAVPLNYTAVTRTICIHIDRYSLWCMGRRHVSNSKDSAASIHHA